MRVAITQRQIVLDTGARADALETDYIMYYQQFGITLYPVPNVLSDVGAYLRSINIDGVILSGGNDVTEEGSSYSQERNLTEGAILAYAFENKLRVFCECRGFQFLNKYLGGSLVRVEGHAGKDHEVLFDGKPIIVNSYHEWAIEHGGLATDLFPIAMCGSHVEAAVHKGKRVFGLMWHPERGGPGADFDATLIQQFRDGVGFWGGVDA